VKVGIASFGAVSPEQRNNFELLKRRYQVFMEARKNCDIFILLDQGNVATDDWLQRNAKRFGSPDIVVGGGTRISLAEPRWVGQTMIVPTGTQGAFVGRVDVAIDGTEKKMTFSRTTIDQTVQDDPEVLKLVQDYMKQQSTAVHSGSVAVSSEPPRPYYAYQSCVSCHAAEYEQWKGTRHAKAVGTLLKQEKAVPDCLPCHSEMYKRMKRVVVSSDQLGGVECMSCHSNVLPHGADYKKKGDTGAIRAVCIECHTPERSPNFDPVAAYEAVRHVR
jgi:hypothetical protein